MSRVRLDQLVAEARAEKIDGGGRLIAMWAGMEAVKIDEVEPCPFAEAEPDLVAGYRRGVVLGAAKPKEHKPKEDKPVFDVTPFHLRAYGTAPVGTSFAARSAPKEEE
jgi:hypothetical protein